MNRSTAREIAVHLTFALAFSSESAEDLLARELTPDRFALRAKDEPLYAEFPGEGELAYITRLVRGVGATGPSWTATSRSTPRGGGSPGSTGWPPPSCG